MPPAVKLYTLSTCSHCRDTKKFMNDCGVQYDFVDVDLLTGDERKQAIEDVKAVNPRLSFPTILIGDTIIIGFKKDDIKEALGQ